MEHIYQGVRLSDIKEAIDRVMEITGNTAVYISAHPDTMEMMAPQWQDMFEPEPWPVKISYLFGNPVREDRSLLPNTWIITSRDPADEHDDTGAASD
jgi:hypothetical protein